METLDAVAFDTTGWTLEEASEAARRWCDAAGDALSLDRFALPPDLAAPLDRLDPIRAQLRRMIADVGGGLVEVELGRWGDLACLRSIVKVPQRPHGMTYVGSFTLPLRDLSYVLKVQCVERGMTGLRDAIVFGQHSLPIGADGTPEGWMADPYDPTFRLGVRRNLADDPRWDAQFPDHPLSRARRHLARLEATLTAAPSLLAAPPFRGGA